MTDQLSKINSRIQGQDITQSSTLAIVNAAEHMRNNALTLPPVERNGALKELADKLQAFELLYKRQGANLVQQNSICLERLHTLATWGVEYDALENADRGNSKTDMRVSFRKLAREKSGNIAEKTARRYALLGANWEDIHYVAQDEFKWAMRNTPVSDDAPPRPVGVCCQQCPYMALEYAAPA